MKYKILKPIKHPVSLEVMYRKIIMLHIKEIRDRVIKKIKPIVKEYYHRERPALITDARDDSFASRFEKEIRKLKENSELTVSSIKKIAKYMLARVDAYNTLKWQKELGDDMGSIHMKKILQSENLNDVMKMCISENINLISSISSEYFTRLESVLYSNLIGEMQYGTLLDQINHCSIVSRSRAKLIARDQVSKVNGSLNRIRQENLGCIGYEWSSSNDSRVRPEDREHNGKFYLWKKWTKSEPIPIAPNGKPFNQPPKDGAPSEKVNCRCTALGVLPA